MHHSRDPPRLAVVASNGHLPLIIYSKFEILNSPIRPPDYSEQTKYQSIRNGFLQAQKLFFIPKSSPLMLQLHPLYPLCNLTSSHYSPQNASNFTWFSLPNGLLHLSYLFFRGVLLSAHPPLLHNPRFTSHRLLDRPITRHTGLVYEREIQSFDAEIAAGHERGEAAGESGVWDFHGNAANAGVGLGTDLHGA